MGQIVFNGQTPKYCNLTAITTGSKKDYLIPDGEIWLIDSTNTSKTDGTGKYDKYIIGDGSHTASYLATNALMNIDNAQQIEIDSTPTSGSGHAVSSGGVYQAIGDIDSQINGKANSADVYTKSEVDNLVEDAVYFGDTVGNVTVADFNAQTDTVWNKTQVLSAAQQAQARTNIGAGNVSSTTINTIVTLTEAQYTALATKDSSTLYIITA